jgi:uncharacterized surface protein with fasciclin (FAS1) repeats
MANLLSTIFKTRELSIFSTAIKVTSLDKSIDEKCEFTLFAPNNLAFAQLSKVNLNILTDDILVLREIISLHIVPGLINYQHLIKMCKIGDREVTLKSIDSSHIHVNLTNGIEIGGATVLSTDTLPSNGIVHIIDRVLMPDEIARSERSPSLFR